MSVSSIYENRVKMASQKKLAQCFGDVELVRLLTNNQFSPIEAGMRILQKCIPFVGAAAISLLAGCAGGPAVSTAGPYHVTAYRPQNPSAVRVKVSLTKQNVYVMEGDRCLMAVACSVGTAEKGTPRGHFTIY